MTTTSPHRMRRRDPQIADVRSPTRPPRRLPGADRHTLSKLPTARSFMTDRVRLRNGRQDQYRETPHRSSQSDPRRALAFFDTSSRTDRLRTQTPEPTELDKAHSRDRIRALSDLNDHTVARESALTPRRHRQFACNSDRTAPSCPITVIYGQLLLISPGTARPRRRRGLPLPSRPLETLSECFTPCGLEHARSIVRSVVATTAQRRSRAQLLARLGDRSSPCPSSSCGSSPSDGTLPCARRGGATSTKEMLGTATVPACR